MKSNKVLFAGAAALLCATTAAQADTVIHLTGSTAFRKATVNAIVAIMGGSANVKSAYDTGSSGTDNLTGSNHVVIQGSIASVPAAGVVTVKCSWAGSVGGIKTVVQNLDVTTWMSISHLGATGTSNAVASGSVSYALDSATFAGETAKADVTMSDSAQASTGFNTVSLTETQVGVVPFEWVACNGSPSSIDNITPLLAQAVISGGAPLSQFSGVSTDTTPVYALGRDFDSGTRLSCLSETGIGVFGGVQHIQPTFNGTAGASGSSINTIKLWQAETVLNQAFTVGNSGYSSGGLLADALATPGASAANTTTGVPGAQQVLFGPGWLIGYLGRSDAARACKTSVIATNNAHRVKFNGVQSYLGTNTINSDGTPAGGYNDIAIREGQYQCWEYEYLTYRSTFASNGQSVANAIAARIISTNASDNGLLLSSMNVSKPVEGGLITHN